MISPTRRRTKRLAVKFLGPHRVATVEEDLPSPAAHQVLVETVVSAISAGTELLIFRGQWPADLAIDETIPALSGTFSYPVKYGYAAVGKVIAVGSEVSEVWSGRTVFAFNPHESHFTASPDRLVVVPDTLSPEQVAFLPNMETAVNLVMDGRPLIGESAVVFGQGVVGLLTVALLSRHPLGAVIAVDTCAIRRVKSAEMGAHAAVDPADPQYTKQLGRLLNRHVPGGGADLTYEVSGNPSALDPALAATGFGGRIVVGSWYGAKPVTVDLGGRFHRSGIQIVSSQVSTLAAGLTRRWTKAGRLQVALAMIEEVRPESLITHRFHVTRAAEAYELVHSGPDRAIQVMLTY
ncbi:MAG: zinc-binding alcohol dehydrogenase [Desulfomonilaceae bacterium]|nr:zinc-binding alcohol dehydrogenase [Desulfomonilaceae bacterium]